MAETDQKTEDQTQSGVITDAPKAGQEVSTETQGQQSSNVTEMGHDAAPLVPKDTSELSALAGAICKSGAVPEAYMSGGSPNKNLVMMGILRGLEVGFYPMTALQWIMPINGRFSVWGDGAIAIIQRRKALEKQTTHWETGGNVFDAPPVSGLNRDQYPDDLTCVVRIKRVGGQWWEGRFSVKDARNAGLWSNMKKKPWQEYPTRMIFNRARAFAIRDGFSDYLNGLYIAEEAQDMPPLIVNEKPEANELIGEVSATQGAIDHDTPEQSQNLDTAKPEPEVVGDVAGDSAGPVDPDAGGVDAAAVKAPPEDDGRIETDLIKQLLNCENPADVDALVAAFAISLDRWRTDENQERYRRVTEQIKGKREAVAGKRRK